MLVATGQLGKFPKVFVWNPMSSPDPTDTPFKEAARRVLYKDIPAVLCFEAVPPKRLFERKVPPMCVSVCVSVCLCVCVCVCAFHCFTVLT